MLQNRVLRDRRVAIVGCVCITVAAAAPIALGQNLITNGGFEAGHTGFLSDYNYSATLNFTEGQYTVRDNGSSFNGFFVNPPPASPGSINMMVVNGSITPGQRIWYSTIAVTPGTTYNLALRGCTAVAGGPAILRWQVDGAMIGSSVTLPAQTREWVDVTAEWTAPAGVTSIQLAVRNLNTSSFPNDFYMDDLSMTAASCPADWDNSGGVDGDDIGAFFADWQMGDADIDQSGGTDGDDITYFFERWQAGC